MTKKRNDYRSGVTYFGESLGSACSRTRASVGMPAVSFSIEAGGGIFEGVDECEPDDTERLSLETEVVATDFRTIGVSGRKTFSREALVSGAIFLLMSLAATACFFVNSSWDSFSPLLQSRHL
jgi:hypothetical protein